MTGGEPGQGDGHLHPLFLEQWNAERPLQKRLESRIQVGHRLFSVPSPQIRVHHVPLDGSRADEGHLDHQVIKTAGTHTGERVHLGPRLDLEHPHRIRRTDHVIYRRIVRRQASQVDRYATGASDGVDGIAQQRQHPEAQEVELDETRKIEVVLVPLDHRTVCHGSPLHRHDLADRPPGNHEPTHVNRAVTGEVFQSGNGPDEGHRPGVGGIEAGAHGATLCEPAGRIYGASAIHFEREAIALLRRKPQDPGRIPGCHLSPICDGLAYHGGVPTTVFLVHVLENFLPVPVGDVQVDVRRLVSRLGEEALEQQVQSYGIHGGDPEAVTDRRIGGGPSALHQNPPPVRESDDVPHDEEVVGQVQAIDDPEFVLDLSKVPGIEATPVSLVRSLFHESPQERVSLPSSGHIKGGKPWLQVGHMEPAPVGYPYRLPKSVPPPPLAHVGGPFEIPLTVGRQPVIRLIQGGSVAKTGQCIQHDSIARTGVPRRVDRKPRKFKIAGVPDPRGTTARVGRKPVMLQGQVQAVGEHGPQLFDPVDEPRHPGQLVLRHDETRQPFGPVLDLGEDETRRAPGRSQARPGDERR